MNTEQELLCLLLITFIVLLGLAIINIFLKKE